MKMTYEDVRKFALQTLISPMPSERLWRGTLPDLCRFAALCYQQGARDMREAAAKACDEAAPSSPVTKVGLLRAETAHELADLIRALALPAGEPNFGK